jgi:anti-sigma factor RsiW
MSDHVLEWLGAYHDGELHGARRRQVEGHLQGCAECRAELEALQRLSVRLQASPPMPARTPPEQFAAGVRLRLGPPPPSERARLRRAAGLWLPLGVAGLWAFGQAVLLVAAVVLALARPADWGLWLDWLVLEAALTAGAAVLAGGCLAGWWAARERDVAPAGEGAG